MQIYIDESEVFKVATDADAWCVVAALVLPKPSLRQFQPLLLPYKLACGKRCDQEIKLRELSEGQIFSILEKLAEIDCSVYCVATEMSRVTDEGATDIVRGAA